MVFLSGDLAGPQHVIVDLVQGASHSPQLAVSTSLSGPVVSVTSSSDDSSGTRTLGITAISSGTGSTLLTVILPTTTSLPTVEASAQPTTSVPSTPSQPTPSPTGAIVQETQSPTVIPDSEPAKYWTAGKIAGLVIGIAAGISLIASGVLSWKRRRYAKSEMEA